MRLAVPFRAFPFFLLLFFVLPVTAQNRAPKPPKTLSANDILKKYVRALGEEKIVKAAPATKYTGTADGGRFTLDLQAPNRARLEILFDADRRAFASNGSSAWQATTREGAATLVDDAARIQKLMAALLAERKFDLKKQAVNARSLPFAQIDGKTCYAVEFQSRQRATARMYFDATTFLPVRLEGGEGEELKRFDFADFRPVDGIREPFRIRFQTGSAAPVMLTVEQVSHAPGFAENHFDVPATTAADVDLTALFARIGVNQKKLDERVTDYTYTLTESVRKLDGDGKIKDTEIKVYEVYPLTGGTRARKLVSVNGKPLSPGDAEKEARRIAKFTEENEERQKKKKESKAEENDNAKRRQPSISDFLRACEFYNPRRETLRGREVIVCDFRPRKNFKPGSDTEKILNKLVGTVWVDRTDEEVSRLEGRFDSDYKVGGGLVASLKRGAAFTYEQTRTAEGVWLPLREDFNAGIKIFLVAGLNVSVENQYSDYKRFTTSVQDEK